MGYRDRECVFLLVGLSLSVSAAVAQQPGNPLCEGEVNPRYVTDSAPLFSWKSPDGFGQKAWQLRIGETKALADDGVSRDYRKGIYATTKVRCREHGNNVIVTIAAPEGPYASKIADRRYRLQVFGSPPKAVTSGGKPLKWTYDEPRHQSIVELPAVTTDTSVLVER